MPTRIFFAGSEAITERKGEKTVARKKTTEVEGTSASSDPPPSDTNGVPASEHGADNGNGQAPRKTVRTFTVQCGKEEHLRVEVVESQFQTREGSVTILSVVCSRIYAKADGEPGV